MNTKIYLLTAFLLLSFGNFFAQTVTFEVRNEKKIGRTYAFDVYMKADQQGTYHSRGQVYLNYNQKAFGESVVAHGSVTVTPLALLTESAVLGAKYQTINIADNGVNLALTWQSNFLGVSPTVGVHTAVPTAQTPLYHIEMEMQDVTEAPTLSFNTQLMKGQQFMLVGSNQELAYGQAISSPVKWVAFTATQANVHDVQLIWKTTNEFNSDHFLIEKKRNNGVFEALTQVDAQGNTQGVNEYAYLDQSGMGNENFYRIKQVDFDGTFQYTDVVMIEMEVVKNDRFIVFPSPATTDVTLKATTARLDADYTFTMSDVSGKIVYTGIMVQNGANASSVDISKFTAGTYYIRTVSPEGKAYLNRFIKVNK